MAESYFELLKHPEWQKKRLRIMERDDFQCRECSDKGTTLNVHHSYYTKGAKPWEYPDESLRTLCEVCHKKRHAIMLELKQVTGELSEWWLQIVVGYAKAMILKEQSPSDMKVRIAEYAQTFGVTDAYCLPWDGCAGPTAVSNAAHEDEWFDDDRLQAIAKWLQESETPLPPATIATDHEWLRSSLRA
jgi:hypothetical protein